MTDIPPGFHARPKSRLLRAHLDLPPELARVISDLAARESEATGERVSVSAVMRRLIREALGRRISTPPPRDAGG